MSDEEREINKLLGDHIRSINEATGVLSRVFRKILADLNVTPTRWNVLMNAYLDDPRNRVPRHSKGRSSTRGNLNKELNKPNMTWANFQKGVRFLRPVEAEFEIRLRFKGGKKTVHKLVIVDEHQLIEENKDDGDE